MVAKALAAPAYDFSKLLLPTVSVNPSKLIRISWYATGEPYFGKSGANRFDAPPRSRPRYGTSYFGFSLAVAIAETILHDAVPVHGEFEVSKDDLIARHVIRFTGTDLLLANMTGAHLRRLGGHSGFSGTEAYDITQSWSRAIYRHPAGVDGFVYMSRHLNTEKAVVLFDRAQAKIRTASAVALPSYRGFGQVASHLRLRGV